MNIRDLQYFVAVADLRHFGKAADACFVSQPTLSTQLKKLEDELGVQLIERTNKQVMITNVGQVILDEARQILQKAQHIKQLAKNSKNPLAGKFTLGIIPTLAPYLLPYILQPIKKQLPELELVIIENKTTHILEQLKAGRLDAVILALPVLTQGFVVENLFYEPFYVLLPKAHPLANKKSISLDLLQRENLLLLEEGHCLREQALEACQYPMASSNEYSATSLETLRQLVGLGAGITLLPALAVDTLPRDKNTVIRPVSGKPPARQIGFLWRDSSARVECCQKIVTTIQQAVENCQLLSNRKRITLLTNSL